MADSHLKIGFAIILVVLLTARAHAVEIYFYQRAYVEGGKGAPTPQTNAAVLEFEKRHPDVHVKIVGVPWGQEGDLKLRTALLAGRRIDCFRLSKDELPGFLPRKGNLLKPIDDLLTEADRADFGPALAGLQHGGKTWAWPLFSTAFVLVANTELLARAGITLPPEGMPWNWEQFTDALKKLKNSKTADKRDVVPFTAAARPPFFEWAPMLMAHCGPLFNPSSPQERIDFAPELANALRRVRDLRTAGLTSPGFGVEPQTTVQSMFLEGRLGLLMTSPGFLMTLAARNSPARVLPPPTGAWGKPITTGGLGCVAVVASGDSAREAAAHALARWLTSEEVSVAVPDWYPAPPARKAVTTFYAKSIYVPLRQIVPSVEYLATPGGNSFYEEKIIPNFQSVILGDKEPEAALKSIQEALKKQNLD